MQEKRDKESFLSSAKQQDEKGVLWESSEKASSPRMGNEHLQTESQGQQMPSHKVTWQFLVHPRRKKAVGMGSLATQAGTALDLGFCFSPQSSRVQALFVPSQGLCYYLASILWGHWRLSPSPLCLLSSIVPFYVGWSLVGVSFCPRV